MAEKFKTEEIASSALFADFSEEEIKKTLRCIEADVYQYKKDRYILRGDDQTRRLVIVLEGRALVISEDADGNRIILAEKQKNDIAGTSLALTESGENIAVVAACDCRVMLINAETVFWGCASACNTHKQLLYNVIRILSANNLNLVRRFHHITHHSLRKKIASFLKEQSEVQDSRDFMIPFDRQEMADYLGADRSALSAELSRMKRDGLLSYHKNHFILAESFFLL